MDIERLNLEIIETPQLNMTDVSGSVYVCNIKLTLKESEAILHSLMRTNCKGDNLTISMELEDRLFEEVIKYYR